MRGAACDGEAEQLVLGDEPARTARNAPPRERTVVEGNIVEHPIWKLSNHQARPRRIMVDKETGKVLIDLVTLRTREYVDPDDYTQVIDLGSDPRDSRKRRQLVIKADLHAGFPTVHAFRVLVVIGEKAHALGYASQKVRITPTQIANGLGMEDPGGKDYESVYGSLDALEPALFRRHLLRRHREERAPRAPHRASRQEVGLQAPRVPPEPRS